MDAPELPDQEGNELMGNCPLCNERLRTGERLVWWRNTYYALDGVMHHGAREVHASCAQELRGEAEG